LDHFKIKAIAFRSFFKPKSNTKATLPLLMQPPTPNSDDEDNLMNTLINNNRDLSVAIVIKLIPFC
jgi:hypothetical protein